MQVISSFNKSLIKKKHFCSELQLKCKVVGNEKNTYSNLLTLK